jgi:hypothetical protein
MGGQGSNGHTHVNNDANPLRHVCENKRMVEEKDLARRRQDIEAVKAAADNPAVARLMMGFPFKVIGNPLREGSRWRDYDPISAAGIDLSMRRSQVV